MADSSPFRTSLHRLDDTGVRMAWEALLAQSEQATAFSTLAYGEAVAEALGYPTRIAGVWKEDDLEAGLLVFEKRRGPFRAAALPPFAQYVTPVLAAPLRDTDVHYQRSALDALADLLRASFDRVNLVLHPSLTDTRAFQWTGWEVEPTYTYRTSVQTAEPVTSEWSATPRRTFTNQAENFDIDHGPACIPDAVALFHASHDLQGHDLGTPVGTLQDFARALVETGLLQVYVARRGAETEAGLFVLSDGRTAHYWLAGSVRGPAMTVLVGEVLERLRSEGVAYFDFAGANIPSIAEFKRKFGGALVPYARARLSVHPLLRLTDRFRTR